MGELIDPQEAIDAIITNKDEVVEALQSLTVEYSGRADAIDEDDLQDLEGTFTFISPVDRHALVLPELHVDHRNEEGGKQSQEIQEADDNEPKAYVDYVSQLVYHMVKTGDDMISSISKDVTGVATASGTTGEEGQDRIQEREERREDNVENDNTLDIALQNKRDLLHLG